MTSHFSSLSPHSFGYIKCSYVFVFVDHTLLEGR